jgi:hypothetical protein
MCRSLHCYHQAPEVPCPHFAPPATHLEGGNMSLGAHRFRLGCKCKGMIVGLVSATSRAELSSAASGAAGVTDALQRREGNRQRRQRADVAHAPTSTSRPQQSVGIFWRNLTNLTGGRYASTERQRTAVEAPGQCHGHSACVDPPCYGLPRLPVGPSRTGPLLTHLRSAVGVVH